MPCFLHHVEKSGEFHGHGGVSDGTLFISVPSLERTVWIP